MDNWHKTSLGLNPLGAIGVFDSGVGGLTVLQALQRLLPQESFLYFGDTARLPYGTRRRSEILQYVREILTWMHSQGVKMAVMACNTSSALALAQVRSEFPFPILGLIVPAAKMAVTLGKRIGVIATPATVKSGAYARALQELSPTVAIAQVACPEFVPLVESNCLEGDRVHRIVCQTLNPLAQFDPDTLIYGCTHYPHLRPVIEQYLPATVHHLDPAHAVARATVRKLEAMNLATPCPQGQVHFYVSGIPEQFAQLASRWLGYYPTVEHLSLSVLTQFYPPLEITAPPPEVSVVVAS
ncbi:MULTISPECIES: glutamate racemase [unclassified Thermosynechococcus]|uniref:glutamate racemase n=1 Tax=unclassified Thermosynechococcus TaxID=2622553 RepID=UPI00197F7BD7|nr:MULTISPECIES: glutamate racemase [unclassified Thermosynechococcus]MDR5639151.1 glutamate racemase [Thermosynechococcus sp. PP42]QSF48288.1 glutamate racemase [Thermosynechococcus sp. TA-1]